MRNALSVDVEDWFQVGAFERTIDRADWDTLTPRVAANTHAVLDLFAAADVKATFFTLGWVAERNPALIRRIVEDGHELASHGWDHKRVIAMTAKEFAADLRRTRDALEQAGATAIVGYRAPSFSINQRNGWAHGVLADQGYCYSSSVAPVVHDHYGWPGAPRFAFRPVAGSRLVELPVTTARLAGRTVAAGGGGFFRLLPYRFSAWAIRQANAARQPAILYFHPWEIDPGQPRVAGAPLRSRLRHYTGLNAMRGKIERLLRDFEWGRVDAVAARGQVIRRADLSDAADRRAIGAIVDAHPAATPFHRIGWIEAVERGCGQRAHVLIGERAMLPLTEIRSRLFGNALVSSGFAVGGGILGEGETAEALAEEARRLAEACGCASVTLRGGWLPKDWNRDEATYLGYARDLAVDDDGELLAIPRKQRAEVRRALGNGLTTDIGDRGAHYAVYAESVRNLGTPVFPRRLFTAVLDAFGDDADILTVRKNGVPLASVLSLYHRGTVMPYWGGGTRDARTWRANDLLYFALMRHARERGCTRFDFGRSKAGTGPAAFKRNWGFEAQPIAYASKGSGERNLNPLDARYSRKVALWKRLPLPVANRVGPLIARGLG